jgi:hypothetical protein
LMAKIETFAVLKFNLSTISIIVNEYSFTN